MLQIFLIPLSNTPQSFQIVLGGITYNMTSKWNDSCDSGWLIDISDSNNIPLAANIPLVTGVDILENLEYLGIPGSLFVNTTGDTPLAVPTLNNLGIDSNLYFTMEVAA